MRSRLRYSWADAGGGEVTEVLYRLEPRAGGTRFSYEHTGFTGVGGFFMAALLGHVRRKMLSVGLPAVLNDLGEDGTLRPPARSRPNLSADPGNAARLRGAGSRSRRFSGSYPGATGEGIR